MKELTLKYGCNPNQTPARLYLDQGELPVEILNGRPGYINFLDALNSWQLVRELKAACNLPAAASFKHVSPAGAALGLPLSAAEAESCFVQNIPSLQSSPLACAYARARGADRMSSFGDWAALSDICDATTAHLLKREVSDGVIAPGYTAEALAILRAKRGGSYNIIAIDPSYEPAAIERKQVFGITFEQGRNSVQISEDLLTNLVTANQALPAEAKRDLVVAMLTLKYTQSNSVCFAVAGQAIGVGAGQQSRVHCTRLAGDKADLWHLRQHEKVRALPFLEAVGRPERANLIDCYLSPAQEGLRAEWQQYFSCCPAGFSKAEQQAYLSTIQGVSLASDAFFPFADNIVRAAESGVSYITQPGGSKRDDLVIAACDHYQMVMAFTGLRLFHH